MYKTEDQTELAVSSLGYQITCEDEIQSPQGSCNSLANNLKQIRRKQSGMKKRKSDLKLVKRASFARKNTKKNIVEESGMAPRLKRTQTTMGVGARRKMTMKVVSSFGEIKEHDKDENSNSDDDDDDNDSSSSDFSRISDIEDDSEVSDNTAAGRASKLSKNTKKDPKAPSVKRKKTSKSPPMKKKSSSFLSSKRPGAYTRGITRATTKKLVQNPAYIDIEKQQSGTEESLAPVKRFSSRNMIL